MASAVAAHTRKYVSMGPIGQVLDEDSWNWLQDNLPELSAAVQEVVGAGGQPDEIRSYVMRQTERRELALRCEQAARHLVAVQQARTSNS